MQIGQAIDDMAELLEILYPLTGLNPTDSRPGRASPERPRRLSQHPLIPGAAGDLLLIHPLQ